MVGDLLFNEAPQYQRTLTTRFIQMNFPTHPQQSAPIAETPFSTETKGSTNAASPFPKLEHVNRPTLETAAAAFYLNRQQQTLRTWACYEDGPLRPVRINGRLAWPVSEIKRVLGVK